MTLRNNTRPAHRSETSPLPHEGNVDAVSSGDSSEGDEAADDGRETLPRRSRNICRVTLSLSTCSHRSAFMHLKQGFITEARALSPRAVTTAPVVALT